GHPLWCQRVPAERQQLLARGRVPELDAGVQSHRRETLAVGAEEDLADEAVVAAQGQGFAVAQALEIAPLPQAQVGGAFVEQAVGRVEVVVAEPLVVRERDAAAVQGTAFALQRLAGALLGGAGLLLLVLRPSKGLLALFGGVPFAT